MHDIPQHIVDRLRILNPEIDAPQTRKIIEALYQQPLIEWVFTEQIKRLAGWLPICYYFNVPVIEGYRWYTTAQSNLNVALEIDHYLNMVGVTIDVLENRRR